MALILPEVARPPLTLLDEEEQLLRQTVREFAEQELAPRARPMDEAGQMDPDLITQLFELGVMGVEVPEKWGGDRRARSSRPCWSWRSSRASTRRSACWSTCRTRWSTTASCAGARRSRRSATCPAWRETRWARTRSPRPAPARMRSRSRRARSARGDDWRAQRAQAVDHERRRGGDVHRLRERATGGGLQAASPRSWSTGTSPGFSVGKKEDKLGIRASSTVRADPRRLPGAERERARRGRQGLQDRDRDAERRPHRHRRADARARRRARSTTRCAYVRGAQAVRPADRGLPGRAVPARADARPSSKRRG